MPHEPNHEWLKEHIRDIPDFPKEGIVFKDITPLLADKKAFTYAIDAIAHHFDRDEIDKVVGIEARGFILAAPVAYHFGAGFVPVRKAGKLPRDRVSADYQLEYGTATLEMHTDAVSAGQRVLLVDDVLATGGTMEAGCRLIEQAGGAVAGCAFLVELSFLGGRKRLAGHDVFSLITY